MKALYSEDGDINIILSRKESEALKGTVESTPLLGVESKNGRTFRILYPMSPPAKDYIEVRANLNPDYPHFAVRLRDDAYADLLREGRCGTRYGEAKKVNVHIGDDL